MDYSIEKPRDVVRFVQRELLRLGYKLGIVDGVYGEKTRAAVEKYLSQRRTTYPHKTEQWITLAFQFIAGQVYNKTISVDGFWGPQSEFVFSELWALQNGIAPDTVWKDHDEFDRKEADPPTWPTQKHIRSNRSIFGMSGARQKLITLPYSMVLAWDTERVVTKISCHEKVAERLQAVLEETLKHYTVEGIRSLGLDQYGGCYNYRRSRGGSEMSMHAWGIAIDMYPAENRLRWNHNQAAFARAEYFHWRRIWREHGATSLGEERNYDWMHFQFARLK